MQITVCHFYIHVHLRQAIRATRLTAHWTAAWSLQKRRWVLIVMLQDMSWSQKFLREQHTLFASWSHWEIVPQTDLSCNLSNCQNIPLLMCILNRVGSLMTLGLALNPNCRKTYCLWGGNFLTCFWWCECANASKTEVHITFLPESFSLTIFPTLGLEQAGFI